MRSGCGSSRGGAAGASAAGVPAPSSAAAPSAVAPGRSSLGTPSGSGSGRGGGGGAKRTAGATATLAAAAHAFSRGGHAAPSGAPPSSTPAGSGGTAARARPSRGGTAGVVHQQGGSHPRAGSPQQRAQSPQRPTSSGRSGGTHEPNGSTPTQSRHTRTPMPVPPRTAGPRTPAPKADVLPRADFHQPPPTASGRLAGQKLTLGSANGGSRRAVRPPSAHHARPRVSRANSEPHGNLRTAFAAVGGGAGAGNALVGGGVPLPAAPAWPRKRSQQLAAGGAR